MISHIKHYIILIPYCVNKLIMQESKLGHAERRYECSYCRRKQNVSKRNLIYDAYSGTPVALVGIVIMYHFKTSAH